MLRPGHVHVTAKLLILASLVCTILAGCDNYLAVYDGHQPLDPDTICIKRYATPACKIFVNSYNKNDLPMDYPKNGSGVDKPEELVLNGLSNVYGDVVYPGIAVKWKSPGSADSRRRLVGYLIVWSYRGSPNVSCNLLLFNTSNENLKNELYFQYSLKVKDLSFYTVEVHSMPTFPTLDAGGIASGSISTPAIYCAQSVSSQSSSSCTMPINESSHGSSSHTTTGPGSAIDVGKYPGDWIPYISYNAFANGTLVVRFTLPPVKYNLRRFSVLLMDEHDQMNPVHDVDVFPPPLTDTNKYALKVLDVKKSGCYYIVIQVREEEGNRLVPGRCSCWVVKGVKRCKPSCGSVQLRACMNVTASPVEENSTGAGPAGGRHIVGKPSMEYQTIDSHFAESITGGLIAAILFLMFIFLIAFCLRHGSSVSKCCKKEPQKSSQKPKDANNSCSVSDAAELIVSVKPSDFTNVMPPTEKIVYIIYARDHKLHLQLVESLIAFLNVHCKCRVISLMQCDCDESEIYQWFLAKISTADYIIFLNSKGAESLTLAFLNKMFRAKRCSREDDFFHFGVKYLMTSEEARENNLILVSFHGKCCQKYLQVPKLYMLPQDLLGLLQKLHNLNEENIKAYGDWLPLHIKNLPDLPEGARLLSAIKAVEDFEESNPGWLEKKFGLKKLLSEDAGYSSDAASSTGLLSIQDSKSSEFDSPVSVFDELDFTICLHANDPQGSTGPQFPPEEQSCIDSRSCNLETELDEVNVYFISDKLNTEGISGMIPWYQLNKLPMEIGHAVNLESESLDGESFIPPETLSEIIYDTYSTALAQINTNGEIVSHHLQSQNCCAGNGSIIDPTVDGIELNHLNELELHPPETPSNIQEENMSAFFRDINANTEKVLLEFNI